MRILILAAACLAFALPANADGGGWQVANKEEDGITVYTRPSASSGTSEVMAEAVVEAPPSVVYKVIAEVEHYEEFMPYLEEARLIERTDDKTWYLYQLLSLPLVSRRDYTLFYRATADTATHQYRIEWEAADQKGPPPRSGVVRVTVCRGSFTMEPLDGGRKTFLTYQLLTDPGGIVPRWIAARANVVSLPTLMRAVRNRSLDPSLKRKER